MRSEHAGGFVEGLQRTKASIERLLPAKLDAAIHSPESASGEGD